MHHAAVLDVGVGADVDGAAPKQPYPDATDDGAEDHHDEPVVRLAPHHEPAQDQQRPGVGDEVAEAAMQQRRQHDAPEPHHGPGQDPEPIEPALKQDLIDDLDGP